MGTHVPILIFSDAKYYYNIKYNKLGYNNVSKAQAGMW